MQALCLAFAFLTRLPTPTVSVTPQRLARALVFFPWIGAALGGLGWLVAGALRGHLPAPLTALLLVALLAAVTGALHLDGIADVFDGLGGGRGDRERTLAIMRDSRIGAHGACALMLVLLAKMLATAELLATPMWHTLAWAPMAARLAAVPLVVLFPYARAAGLGTGFREAAGVRHLAGAVLITLPLLAWAGPAAGTACGMAAVAALGIGLLMHKQLGGLTGDVYGAAIELGEVAYLVTALYSK